MIKWYTYSWKHFYQFSVSFVYPQIHTCCALNTYANVMVYCNRPVWRRRIRFICIEKIINDLSLFIHTIRFRKLDKYIIHNWIIHTKKSSYQLSCFLAWFYLIQNVRKIRFTLRPKSFWFFYICVFAKCFLSLSWSIVLFKSFVMIFWAKMFFSWSQILQ